MTAEGDLFPQPKPNQPSLFQSAHSHGKCQGPSEVKRSGTGWARSDFSRERWQNSKHPASSACPSAALVQYMCVSLSDYFSWTLRFNSSACFQPILLCLSNNHVCPISGSSQLSAHPTILQWIKKHKRISIAQNQRERASLLCLYNRKKTATVERDWCMASTKVILAQKSATFIWRGNLMRQIMIYSFQPYTPVHN